MEREEITPPLLEALINPRELEVIAHFLLKYEESKPLLVDLLSEQKMLAALLKHMQMYSGESSNQRILALLLLQLLVVASDIDELLFGKVDESSPSATHPGYWLAAWSPTRAELATLDAQRE